MSTPDFEERLAALEAALAQRELRYWRPGFVSDEKPAANQVPAWDDTAKKFRPTLPADLKIASQAQGDILYFNGTNWVRLAPGTSGYFLQTQGASANPQWAAGATMKAPVAMTMDSLYALGVILAANAVAAPASGLLPSQNTAIFYPFWLPEAVTLAQIFWRNGATVSGNVDLGVYDSALARKISTGSTAQSGINATQSVDVADTALAAGLYYMSVSQDNASPGAMFHWSLPDGTVSKFAGLAQMATAFPLPATAILAATTLTSVFEIGFTTRAFI